MRQDVLEVLPSKHLDDGKATNHWNPNEISKKQIANSIVTHCSIRYDDIHRSALSCFPQRSPLDVCYVKNAKDIEWRALVILV